MALVPLLSLIYAGTVLYQVLVVSKLPLDGLYTWHPICSNLFIVFASLGMWSAQSIRGKAALSRSAKEPYVTRHAIFNWLALFSLVGAGATIYLNKERAGRPHLATYHGVTGACVAGFFVMNVLGGGAMNTVPSLYKYIKFHRLSGYVLFLALLGAHGTAVWRGYAGFKAEPNGRYALVGLLGGIALATLSGVKLSLLPGAAAKAKAN
ncbi:hypothetical protein HXX76_015519 [Chlamydomonas incerta]|uniref:Cytochrome b561 domain-containing protein n=1 Tax=Chlamydomonas incerta TaxID=51695 RepID=A0A835VRS6_CHLIN|nr:hypothetical protein HXX76_015519 [Chlamydomonas incerta]|eukprot:KAG2423134.1 hypothetical protein HXX76_015519 [Chlamydomonas incerta]